MKLIALTQGQFAIVDDEDYDELSKFKWFANKDRNTFYAARVSYDGKTKKNIRMHRLIMGFPQLQIDHRNGNGLDNRKFNLRIVDTRQNGQNRHDTTSSRFPGVYWRESKGRWIATITHKGKRIYLGSFREEVDAFKCYLRAIDKFELTVLPELREMVTG